MKRTKARSKHFIKGYAKDDLQINRLVAPDLLRRLILKTSPGKNRKNQRGEPVALSAAGEKRKAVVKNFREKKTDAMQALERTEQYRYCPKYGGVGDEGGDERSDTRNSWGTNAIKSKGVKLLESFNA